MLAPSEALRTQQAGLGRQGHTLKGLQDRWEESSNTYTQRIISAMISAMKTMIRVMKTIQQATVTVGDLAL